MRFLAVLLFSVTIFASEVVLDLDSFVEAGLEADLRLSEKRYGLELERLKISSLKNSVILPRFEVGMAFGPAPGLTEGQDEQIIAGDTVRSVAQNYDFTKLGPYWGTEIKVAQPLNISRLLSGLRAARAGLRVSESQVKMREVSMSRELQDLYFGMVFAFEMERLSEYADRELSKARDRIEELLDDDDESVSQEDFLEIKVQAYKVDKGLIDSRLGLARARLGARFSLNLPFDETFRTADTIQQKRNEIMPPLAELKKKLLRFHPELSMLENGLLAREELLKIAEGELGPDFFIFGSFTYAKAWAGERGGLEENVFSQDPLNKLDGTLGLGLKLRLNFWAANDKIRKKRIELRMLKRTEAYAARGLLLLLEEEYLKMLATREKVESAERSMRAAEAMFKGAAMKYDVDPSEGRKLMNAFKKRISTQKDYGFAVYDYNRAVAAVFARVGWTLSDYNGIYRKRPVRGSVTEGKQQ